MTSALRNHVEDKAWNYLSPYEFVKDHVWMKPLGGDLYECVILQGLPNCRLTNSNDPPGSFYTSDVFTKHPTLPNRWKLIGRQDDMINMGVPEMFPALPFEDHMKQHPFIDEAVVFGNGRPELGFMVFCSERAKDKSTTEVVTDIWPLVEQMNAKGSERTRIAMDMIIVMPFGEAWPRTDKQNVIRPQVYRQYEELINEMYQKQDKSAPGEATVSNLTII